MKKTIHFLTICLLACAALSTSCKKESSEKKQEQQINQVLPQKYIDSLKNLGLVIYEGVTPPNVNGIFLLSPHRLKASNFSDFLPVGSLFLDGKLKIENQNNTTFSVDVLGKNFLSNNDTSIVAAISGSGDNFTIYSKIRASSDEYYADFALIMSGTKNTSGFKNFEYGIISIDASHGGGNFISEGKARLVYDADFTSPTTTVFKIASETMPKDIKSAGMR